MQSAFRCLFTASVNGCIMDMSGFSKEGEQMRQIGDVVLHGSDGCCRIMDIRRIDLTGEGQRDYYILEPLYSRGVTVYVEAEENDSLREPMQLDQINALLESVRGSSHPWISNEKERQAALREILREGSIPELFRAFVMLYNKRLEQQGKGRKFHISDEHCLEQAERIINRELAYGIGVEPDAVPAYIRSVMEA